MDKPGDFLIEEIKSAPCSIRRALSSAKEASRALARRIAESGAVAFIGSGSSYNAALPASWLLRQRGFPAWVLQACEVKEFGLGLTGAVVPVLISVSGEGEDIIGAATSIVNSGNPMPGVVCNTPGASLISFAREKLMLDAGPQRAEAATHTFLASMAALLQLALDVLEEAGAGGFRPGCSGGTECPGTASLSPVRDAPEPGAADEKARKDELGKMRENLRRLPGIIEGVLKRSLETIPVAADFLSGRGLKNLAIVGFGPGYAACLDGALKIKEVAQVFAEAHEGDNVLHGPAYPIVYHKIPVVILGSTVAEQAGKRLARFFSQLGCRTVLLERRCPPGPCVSEIETRFEMVDAGGVSSTGNITRKNAGYNDYLDIGIYDEEIPEVMVPFAGSVPLQLLAYELGKRLGLDVDTPPTKASQIQALARCSR